MHSDSFIVPSLVSKETLVMGILIAGVALFGLWHARWLSDRTAKGQALARWFGPDWGLRVLRLILFLFVVIGVGLALGWIRPLQWS